MRTIAIACIIASSPITIACFSRAKARASGQAVSGPTPCQECHGR